MADQAASAGGIRLATRPGYDLATFRNGGSYIDQYGLLSLGLDGPHAPFDRLAAAQPPLASVVEGANAARFLEALGEPVRRSRQAAPGEAPAAEFAVAMTAAATSLRAAAAVGCAPLSQSL